MSRKGAKARRRSRCQQAGIHPPGECEPMRIPLRLCAFARHPLLPSPDLGLTSKQNASPQHQGKAPRDPLHPAGRMGSRPQGKPIRSAPRPALPVVALHLERTLTNQRRPRWAHRHRRTAPAHRSNRPAPSSPAASTSTVITPSSSPLLPRINAPSFSSIALLPFSVLLCSHAFVLLCLQHDTVGRQPCKRRPNVSLMPF
jgi:hypothetical protein